MEGTNKTGTVDFNISFDNEIEEYIVDFFDAKNPDIKSAYIETLSYETLDEAWSDAEEYQLRPKVK